MARKPDGVELVISARNESEKAFAELTDAIKEIENVAKKGGGFSELFVGLEARLETLSKRQQQFNKALGDTSSVQRGIDAASRFTEVLKDQEKAAGDAQQRLSQLEEEFEGIEAAANAAREPNEKLQKSLTEQRARQGELAQAIAKTTAEVHDANAAMQANAGVDEKAAAAIEKQKQAVIGAGQAWRATTQQIKAATDTIRAQTGERDVLVPLRDQAQAQLKQLQAEFRRVQAMANGFQRNASKEGAGGAVQALARQAKQELARLSAEIEQQKTLQFDLAKQVNTANTAISKQTTAVEKLSARGRAQREQYQALKNSLKEFTDATQAEGASRQSANIEKLQKSLAGLQAAYDATTRKVQNTEQALAASVAPDPRAIKQREAYAARIGEAIAAVQREQKELSRLRTELNSAGISANTLADRQRELDQITTKLTADQAKLHAETKKLDAANKGAIGSGGGLGAVFRAMGKDTRQSLGYLQRIRGELLSIAATYTGLYAVGGAVKSIYDASVLLNKAQARFGVAFGGDQNRVADEIEFVRKETDRLSISFETALDQYSKLVSGLPDGLLTVKETRAVFTGFATAARTAGLSGEELERVFNAVSQIFSKQQVQLEELKGQLGDALPGAVQATAKALGTDPKSLFKQIEEGNVGFEAAILLADQLAIQYGTALPQALKSPAAAVDTFKNQWFQLRQELAESGFIENLTEALREATKAIKSPEFREGAKQMAAGIGGIVKAVVFLIKNFEGVKTGLITIAAFMGVRAFYNFSERLFQIGGAARAMGIQLGGASTNLGKFTGALGMATQAIPVAMAAFALGTYLQSEFKIVRQFGVAMIGVFETIRLNATESWQKIIAVFQTGYEKFSDIAEKAKRLATDPINAARDMAFGQDPEIDGISERFAKIEAETLQARKNLGSVIADMLKDIDAEFDNKKSQKNGVIDVEQVKKDAAEASAAAQGLFTDAEREDLRNRVKRNPEGVMTDDQIKALKEKITNALVQIDAEIQEKSGATLQERLDALRAEYAKLSKDIQRLGGNAFPNAQGSIDQIVAIKQVEEAQKEINGLIQERRTLIQSVNELQELGTVTVEEATKRINDENGRIMPKLNEALAVARQIASTVNSPVVTQQVDNSAQLVALETERVKKEQLLALEQQINQTMSIRAERIQTVNALVDTGVIGEYEGRKRIYEINGQTSAQMDELIAKAMQMAEALGDPVMVERLKQMSIELSQTKDRIIEISTVQESFASGLTDAFESFITGAASAKEAFRNFALDFLKQVARMITQALILRAIQSAFGGATGGTTVPVQHTGGIVGGPGMRRKVPVTAFAYAARYHNGGIAGLRPNEVPTILERGEEVLPASDPRHQANGGGASTPIQVKIVNAIDSGSVVNEGLNTAVGQRAIINAIRANKSSIKSVLS